MPTTQHIEKHFTATETVRDIVIGMSDGLTVPCERAELQWPMEVKREAIAAIWNYLVEDFAGQW
jgi:hypothetical protein